MKKEKHMGESKNVHVCAIRKATHLRTLILPSMTSTLWSKLHTNPNSYINQGSSKRLKFCCVFIRGEERDGCNNVRLQGKRN